MSSAPTPSPTMSAQDLLMRPASAERCELIQGELKMMSPAGGQHGLIGMRLVRHLDRYLQEQPLGEMTLAETGFLLERDPDTVRAPDIAFIATERIEQARTPRFIPVAPDLAVEVNSPSDRAGDVVEKVRWWLAHGTRLVWVVDPKTKTVTAYHPDGSARVTGQGDTLEGDDILPGFSVRIDTLFTS